MPCAEWVNLSAACEKVVAVDCAALVRPVRASVRWRMVESVAAVGLGAAGDRIGRALELADHGAEFEFQQFQDFPGRIALGADGIGRNGQGWRKLGCDGRRSRFRRPLSKQTECHGRLLRGE